MHAAYNCACVSAGPYETYQGSPVSRGELQHDMWGVQAPRYSFLPCTVWVVVQPRPVNCTAISLSNSAHLCPQCTTHRRWCWWLTLRRGALQPAVGLGRAAGGQSRSTASATASWWRPCPPPPPRRCVCPLPLTSSAAAAAAAAVAGAAIMIGASRAVRCRPLRACWGARGCRLRRLGLCEHAAGQAHRVRLWHTQLTDAGVCSELQILGNNECFEPYTSNIYVRRVLSGEFTVRITACSVFWLLASHSLSTFLTTACAPRVFVHLGR